MTSPWIAVALTVFTAVLGVALLVVLVWRTVLAENAVDRERTTTGQIRTGRVRLLDRIAIVLALLVFTGSIVRIVTGMLAAAG